MQSLTADFIADASVWKELRLVFTQPQSVQRVELLMPRRAGLQSVSNLSVSRANPCIEGRRNNEPLADSLKSLGNEFDINDLGH